MTVVKYCGLALLALSVMLIVSELKPKIAKLIGLCVGVAMITAAFANFYPTVRLIGNFVRDTPLAAYSSTLLKALGVALAVEICADICRDAGEALLATRLEMIGKAELLLLSLPLVSELMEIAGGLF